MAQADPGAVRPAAPARAAPPARTAPAPRKASYRVVRMRVTGYCPCVKCCGKTDGITASGRTVRANGGAFVAADPGVSFGTMVSVPGYHGGQPVPVQDRGSKIVGNRLDVFFSDHATAQRWGTRWLDVKVYRD